MPTRDLIWKEPRCYPRLPNEDRDFRVYSLGNLFTTRNRDSGMLMGVTRM